MKLGDSEESFFAHRYDLLRRTRIFDGYQKYDTVVDLFELPTRRTSWRKFGNCGIEAPPFIFFFVFAVESVRTGGSKFIHHLAVNEG